MFNFIGFHVLQLMAPWSPIVPHRHRSSDHIGAIELWGIHVVVDRFTFGTNDDGGIRAECKEIDLHRKPVCTNTNALPWLASCGASCRCGCDLTELMITKSRDIFDSVRPHLHANTNEAGRDETYANICLDCNTRQNVVVRRASEWFSLKYRLQADSVGSASDRTEAFSSPWLRCVHICTQTQTRQAKARHTRTYALIATRGKMLSFAEPVNDSPWSTYSRRIAFVRPQTEQRQFSSPRLYIYITTHASPWSASRAFLF